MADFVTRDEFQQLATRVDIIEREVEGEKLVTRHVLEQTRRNGAHLAAIKTRLDRVEGKVDGLSSKVDGLSGKFDGLNTKFDGLTRSLTTIVGDVVREVLRERDGD